MTAYVDLHLHYVPGVDDGVRTFDEGIALCRGLAQLGYTKLITTPHIRAGMFDNQPSALREAFTAFEKAAEGLDGMPELGLAAEHFFDDVFWRLCQAGQALAYPGGYAALVEFPDRDIPLRVEARFYEMRLRGLAPVLAHPERYRALFRKTKPLESMLDSGLMLQLDLMSLTGRYGRKPRDAAERMLEEEAYFVACSDAHRPADVDTVSTAIERLKSLVGDEYALELLSTNPAAILSGDFDA